MSTVKTHKRKGKNKVSVVKQHERKDKDGVSKYRKHKEFSSRKRENMAEKGTALPDGSFPIDSKRDLANAISSYGRAKNPEVVKRWIKKRAKALGACDMIPESWCKK